MGTRVLERYAGIVWLLKGFGDVCMYVLGARER